MRASIGGRNIGAANMRLQLKAQSTNFAQASKAAFVAAALSASLVTSPPALAVPPPINEAIVEASEATYPILKALDPQAFESLTEKIGKLLLDIDSFKLGRAIDLGVDVFLTPPTETVTTFNGAVKEAFAGLKTDSCTLVPIPPRGLADKFAKVASTTVDSAKLKALDLKWGPTLDALPKTDASICLPSVEALDKLALAQADVGRAFDFKTEKKFFAYAVPMLKGEIKLTDDTMAVAIGAKKQIDDLDVSRAEKAAFQAAGKKLEASSKAEKEKQAAARYKAEVAEAAAAKKAAAAAAKM